MAIGDIYAGEQKDLLLRLELPQISTPVDQFPVLSLEARYLDISNACMQSLQLAVTIPRTRSPLASQIRNHFVLQHVQRCETSSALQAASEMADMGDLSG